MKGPNVDILSRLITLEITSACNLQCAYCYNSKNRIAMMEAQQISSLLEEFSNVGITRIALSGGEPLLHPDIDMIMENLLEKGFQIRLLTNGLLLDRKHLDWFIQRNAGLQISLDGCTETINDYYRGKGSFRKNLDSIQYLSKAGYRKGVLRMTISKHNYQQVTAFYEFSRENGMYPAYSIVQRLGRANETWGELCLSSSEYDTVLAQMHRIADFDPEMKAQLTNIQVSDKCALLANDETVIIKPVINVYGDLYPCYALSDDEFVLGNVFLEGTSKALSTINKDYVDRLKKTIIDKHVERCETCFLHELGLCCGGCPAIVLASTKEELERECTKKKIQYLNRLR